MQKLTYSEIDWNSPRGEAYRAAKASPGRQQRFQAEEGYSVVTYHRPLPSAEIMGTVISEGRPGYWYERPELDLTKMLPDPTVGFRVYDESGGE